MLRVLDILPGTSVDGPGLRTSVYFAGCNHHCPECHNPQSWDHEGGTPMTVDEIMAVIEENGFNVTFSGGDPFFQGAEMAEMAARVKEAGYTLWVYTGFTHERLKAIAAEEVRHEGVLPEVAKALLAEADVLVDGPYIAALRDISLHFRGSSNQRIIELKNV